MGLWYAAFLFEAAAILGVIALIVTPKEYP